MDDLVEKKLAKLREIAKLDSSYSSILQRYLVLEKQFSDMTTTLSSYGNSYARQTSWTGGCWRLRVNIYGCFE